MCYLFSLLLRSSHDSNPKSFYEPDQHWVRCMPTSHLTPAASLPKDLPEKDIKPVMRLVLDEVNIKMEINRYLNFHNLNSETDRWGRSF